MPRTLSNTIRAGLEGPRDSEALLAFITIDHDDIADPIRVVNDTATANGKPVTYTYGGNSYIAYPFEIELLTDSGKAPTATLSIQNVDREIGETIRDLVSPPSFEIAVIPASEFDLTINPRTEITAATPIYEGKNLTLRNIGVDALMVSGEIASLDDSGEPFPYLRATEALLPGLFR